MDNGAGAGGSASPGKRGISAAWATGESFGSPGAEDKAAFQAAELQAQGKPGC